MPVSAEKENQCSHWEALSGGGMTSQYSSFALRLPDRWAPLFRQCVDFASVQNWLWRAMTSYRQHRPANDFSAQHHSG